MSVGFSESVVTPGITSLVSKGDIVSSDGTSRVRVPVGTDGKVFTSQSSTSTGVFWETAPVASQSSLVLIESSTLTSAAASYTFSSLPASYHTFRLIVQGKVTTTATGSDGRELYIRLNGDTDANNYMVSYSSGISTAATSNTESKGSNTAFLVGPVSSDMGTSPDNTYYRGMLSLEISDSSNTSVYKNIRATSGNGQGPDLRRISGLYISTSAVTSITVIDLSRDLGPGTSIELYGMK